MAALSSSCAGTKQPQAHKREQGTANKKHAGAGYYNRRDRPDIDTGELETKMAVSPDGDNKCNHAIDDKDDGDTSDRPIRQRVDHELLNGRACRQGNKNGPYPGGMGSFVRDDSSVEGVPSPIGADCPLVLSYVLGLSNHKIFPDNRVHPLAPCLNFRCLHPLFNLLC